MKMSSVIIIPISWHFGISNNSTNFCKTLRDAQGVITRAELLKRMRASLKHEGYDQIPQLECPAAAKKKKLLE
jgi:hypothetical protein